MIVLKRTAKGYAQDPTKHFNFTGYAQECGDFVLIEAAFEYSDGWSQFGLAENERKSIFEKRIVRLEFEEPNKFFLGDKMDSYDGQFYRIFTLCPYTSEWLNGRDNVSRRVPIFFPFNERDIPAAEEKKYDIVYSGHIVSNVLLKDLYEMQGFAYRFISNSEHPLVTDRGVDYNTKLKLNAQSKITLVQNLLYPAPDHIRSIWKYRGWQNNHAFDLVPRRMQIGRNLRDEAIVVPQLKSRVFEAAFSRSLILCKHDHFNVIERYFTPDKEFVYYENGKLKEKVQAILGDYASYQPIADAAFERAIRNYTTEKFVENYLKKIE